MLYGALTGSNLRAAIDFAKREPCVLLLDEIDAIAKRRSDDTDVGELKRLVTVILQEVDEWPATSVLLAATNHPKLIDPALWRRFDLVAHFNLPERTAIKEAVKRFLGPDYALFARGIDILSFAFQGHSFSDIEREIQRFRRALALGTASDADLMEEFIKAPKRQPGKAQAYTIQQARKRLAPQFCHTAKALDALSTTACPDDFAVARLMMNPSFIARSYFPTRLLRAVGLESVGSRTVKVTPEAWTKKCA